MKTRQVLVLLIIMTSFRAYSQVSEIVTKSNNLTNCIDSSEFKIGGLYFEQEKSDVIKLIGQPDSIKIDSFWITTETHYYKGLSIYYLDDGLASISALSDKYTTPSGIHTGLSREKVFEILGLKPNEITSKQQEMSFFGCHDKMYFIQFLFDSSFILREFGIGVDIM